MRSALALRASLVTATVAGTLIAPAASSAFAAATGTTAPCVSTAKHVPLGAGLAADLTMSSQGPKAVIKGADPTDTWSKTLTRTSPNHTNGVDIRILNPSGAKPALKRKTQGGNTPYGNVDFPALPKGCKAEYTVTGTAAPKPAPAKTTAAPKAQTSEVPKGSVAAGAEIPVAPAEDTDNTITLAAGAGLVGIVAVLGTVLLRRRRSHG